MFNVAVLGYRHQGSRHHAPSFARLPDCRIVAVCDIVPERAREGAKRYRVPSYTNADEMLDKEQIDIVNLPVGEKYRYDLLMKCFQRGKHVFTEKPLLGELGQFRIRPSDIPPSRALIDEWRKRGVAFGMCFCLHGAANVRRAKEVIRSGCLGPVRMIIGRCAQGSWNHLIDMVR
ncbi:MAG: Gfo/Idh/MocA family oxidoreductase, partial [Planctomycetes bacterium]|nr:Gfo/Idh/MocA family oxidoreductase [Planctomycetota bacterium]